jgi:hypothetical protein
LKSAATWLPSLQVTSPPGRRQTIFLGERRWRPIVENSPKAARPFWNGEAAARVVETAPHPYSPSPCSEVAAKPRRYDHPRRGFSFGPTIVLEQPALMAVD